MPLFSSISEVDRKYCTKFQEKLPVTEIVSKTRGCPPILLELDEKLRKAIRMKGGVVSIYVVRATATALIETNPSASQNLRNFSMPRSWVQSLYRHMGLTRRAGTTSRPAVPQGLFDECRLEYLGDIYKKINSTKSPLNLFSILIKRHHLMYLLASLQWQCGVINLYQSRG